MIPSFLLQKEQYTTENKPVKTNLSFIDRTSRNASHFIISTLQQHYISESKGTLQKLDSRVKVLFLLGFILLINLTHHFIPLLIIALTVLILNIISKLPVISIYKKVLFLGFFFGFLLFLPASLNLVTTGQNVFTVMHFTEKHQWWIYSIPNEITITLEGILVVLRLTLKIINSVSVVLLILYTTKFERIIKSLAFFKFPGIFLLTLTMSYKFIYILSLTIEETYQALKMRWWNRGKVNDAENRIAGRIGFMFRKSWERYELTYQSMIARGFNGSVNLCYIYPLKRTDYIFILTSVLYFTLLILTNIYYA